nr:hypothetical protein [uncultured Pedobacter sp.]
MKANMDTRNRVIHIKYDFKGPAENQQTALNAVNDSQEEYCGVSDMLKKVMPIT